VHDIEEMAETIIRVSRTKGHIHRGVGRIAIEGNGGVCCKGGAECPLVVYGHVSGVGNRRHSDTVFGKRNTKEEGDLKDPGGGVRSKMCACW